MPLWGRTSIVWKTDVAATVKNAEKCGCVKEEMNENEE